MKRKDYRMKPYSILDNIYVLQKRFLWIFWRTIDVGAKKELESFLSKLEE